MADQVAKKHHFVPKFLLTQFTENGDENEYLTVLDIKRQKSFPSKPENIAFQRKLYSTSVANLPLDYLETSFSKVETKGADVIKSIIRGNTIPQDDKEFSIFLNILTLQYVRTPSYLKNLSSIVQSISESFLRNITSTRESYESVITKVRADGIDLPDMDYEDFKRSINSGNVDVIVPQELKLSLAFNDQFDSILEMLSRREWFVLSIDSSDCFVCSDIPVSLNWEDPRLDQVIPPPGFDSPHTEIVFPISKKHAILGVFGKGLDINEMKANTDFPSIINARTIEGATQIYFSGDDFKYMRSDGSIGHKGDFLKIK